LTGLTVHTGADIGDAHGERLGMYFDWVRIQAREVSERITTDHWHEVVL
jgi:hypothetical protein